MRTQPRFSHAVTHLSLGVAALAAVLFAAGCASNGSGTSGPTAPNLSATVSASGAVNPGQTGKYTILVSNASGALATSGTVTLTDPPTGFTITGASGTDWTCTLSGTPPGVSCTNSDVISPGGSDPLITVTGTVTGAAGSTISVPITISGGGLTTSGSSQGSVAIVSPPTISKAFGANSIGVSATTTLTFTVTNPSANTVAQTGLAFSDTFPANLVVAPTPGVNNTCGGTPTAAAGAGVVSLTGGTAGVNTTCTLAVNVTSATVGSYQTSVATLTSTNGGTGSDTNATQPTLGVVAFPTVSKAFGASSVSLNGSTSLSFTVGNPAANSVSLAGIGFTDSFPAGVVVATPNGLTGTCGGGTITGTAGASSVTLAGATLTQNTSCNFSVNVTGTTPGAKNNAITAISSTQSGTGTINSTASLTVLGPPTISDAFGAASVPLNAASTSLTFTLTNPNASTALAGVAFTDTLPAGLVISTPNGLSSSCSGTATATQATTSISLTAGTLAAGGSCTFVLNVTGTSVGAQANTSAPVTSTNGGTGVASNTATLAVLGPPTISKAFNPGGIAVNGTSALTFTLTNPPANTLGLTGVGFVDTLPANTTVASPNGLTNNCGGTATAVAGSNSVSLSGVSLTTATPTNTCTLVVNVTATAAGAFTNTTAAVTSANGGTGLTASAALTAAAAPAISKSFLPTSIPLNGTSTLSFTITSPAANPAPLTNIAFTDTLPGGLAVSTPNGLTGSCGGGTITGTAGANSVSLAGATLAPNASCTFSVNVTASAAGAKSNTTGAISSTQSGPGSTSNTAILTVILPPMISDAFGAPSVPLSGTPTSLTFTLTNPNASAALTGVAFTDVLPAGLVISSPNALSNTCNGTPTATAGSSAISLTGGTLAAGGSCTVVLNVSGTAVGADSNTTGAVSSTEGGTGAASNTASLAVLGPPTIGKAFGASGVAVNGVTSLTFTLTNPAANTLALTGVSFTDALPSGTQVAATPGVANACGGTPTATAGAGTVSLSGVTLAPSGSCTLAVNVTATQAGTFNNTTAAVSSTNGGTGLSASASLNAAAPPMVSDLFGLSSIPVNTSTSLSFAVTNPSTNTVPLTNISFADTLPSGLVISTPNGLTGTCGGGTITAAPATNSISLTGATLTPGTQCNFSVNVTAASAGALNNITGAISSTQSGAGLASSPQTLTVVAPPTFSKAFGAGGIGVNASTTLTFTLTNPAANTVTLTGVGFNDTFPAGLQLTATPIASNTCGVAPTANANTALVGLSGVSLPAASTCTLIVNVTAIAPGAFNNITSAVTSANGGNGLTASATLTAAAAPTISKVFGASSIALNASTSLSFTVTNPAANTLSLGNIAFTDALPTGLVVSTPNGESGACGGGAIGATQGSSTVTLGGATLAPAGTCTFSVNVTGTTAGAKNNTTSPITSTQSGAGLTSNTATLTVVAPPQFTSGVFVPANIPVGSSSTFTVTINNPNAASILTGVGFTDTLPAGLTVAASPALTTTCGGTTASGTNTFSLSGGTLPAGASCTFSVSITGTAAGSAADITTAVTSNEGGSGNTTTANVAVLGPPTISKAFGAAGVPVGGTTTLTFTLTSPAANTLALTGVAFSDAFPANLQLTGTPLVSNTCGGTPTAVAASGTVSLTGATIAVAPSNTCTLVVNVTATASGTFNNTTGAISSTNGGTGAASNTATLNAALSPTFSKAFGASSIALNASTSLTFTIGNPSSNTVSLGNLAFTDSLPSGLVVSTPNGEGGTCIGTIVATAGSGSVSLAGTTLTPGASCSFAVNVTGKSAGVQNNTTGQISSTQSGPGPTANASVTVVAPPTISKQFGGSSVVQGSSTSLSFTITNPNTSNTLSGVAFTDTMPAGLVVATPNGLTGSCGSGAITAVAGSSSVSLSGGTLATSGSCNFSVNVTGTATGTQNNITSAVASTEGGTGGTASASITVGPACTTNCMISGTVSGPSGSVDPWVEFVNVQITGANGSTLQTAANGTYGTSANLTEGTQYTITPSLAGYTFTPPSATITLTGNAAENFTITPVISSSTITGTLSYSLSPSGVTYVNVYQTNCPNCGAVGGTTVPRTAWSLGSGTAPYTIRGLPQTQNGNQYVVRAEMDSLGTGILNVADPAGNSNSFSLTSSNQSGVNVTLATQTVPTLSTPQAPNVFPGNGTAFIVYNDQTNSNGDEEATSWTLSYGTTTGSCSSSNLTNTQSFAENAQNLYLLSGLANGSQYCFAISGTNTQGPSAQSPIAGPVTIGATTGGITVSGTVTFTGTPNASAPLYVGVFSETQGVYFQRIAPGFSSGVAYSFAGIPSGNYAIFAVLDQNNNGYIDPGDITNFNTGNGPPLIAVNSAISGKILPLGAVSGAGVPDAYTFVATSTNTNASTTTHGINFGAQTQAKLPVSITLFSGPNVALPFDVTNLTNNSGGSPIFSNSATPNVGDTYDFLVVYSDGTTQVLSSSVTGVLNPPQNLTISGSATVPTFNWTAPSPVPSATPYTYSLQLSGQTDGENWQDPKNNSSNGLLSTTTSVTFGSGGSTPSPNSSLTPGNAYNWSVQVTDANGNSAQNNTTYTVPGSVGPPAKLVFTEQPGSGAPGTTLPTVKVAIEDASNNIVTTATGYTISLNIAFNAGGGTLSGGGAVSPVNGVATFSNLSINNAGNNYTLSASSSPSLTTPVSNSFSVGNSATSIQNISINPFVVAAGTNPTGTVTLNGIAPSGGTTVTLSSSNTSAATVQNVTVPSGSSSANFTVTTLLTTAPAQTKITATFNGTNNSQQMWINPPGTPYLTGIAVSPSSIDGSFTAALLTATLSGPAPSGGAVVALQSDNPAALGFGSATTFMIAPGATSGTLSIATEKVNSIVNLTADYNGPAGASLTIYSAPVVASITLSARAATAGTNPTATVTLSGSAPTGGAVVSLSSNSAFASVPTSITISANATVSSPFTVTTTAPTSQQSATITASYGGPSAQANLTLEPASTPVLASIIIDNATVVAGIPTVVGATTTTVTGTVTLDAAAPAGGAIVTLSSNDTSAAQVPATVSISAGNTTSGPFAITTSATTVTTQTLVTLSGTYGGVTQTATLGVDPPLAITTTNMQVAALGVGYPTVTIAHTAGIGPFTYQLVSSAPPTGLSLSPSGSTAGQVTGITSASATVGNTSFTVTVTDSQSHVSTPVVLTIPVVNPASACGTASDPRGVLNGGYAALLQGWTTISGTSYPVAEIFRFTANGNGTIGNAGTMDINTGSSSYPHQQLSITGGTYSIASDNSGCLQLNFTGDFGSSSVNTIVYHFAVTELNGPNSNNAMIGRIIQFDNYTGTGPNTAGTGFDVTGVMHYQDLSFANINFNDTSGLGSRFVYGADGEVLSSGSFVHFSNVGSFNLDTTRGDPTQGAITNLYFDADAGGSITQATGGTGQISSDFVGATTGRGAFSVTSGGVTYNDVFYVVNPNEYYVMETDSVSGGFPLSAGRGIVTASYGSYSAGAETGNYLIDLAGLDGSTPDVLEGIVNIAAGGAVNANLNDEENGFYQTEGTDPGQAVSVDPNSGRTTITGGGGGSPILYPAVPVLTGTDRTEPISVFFGGSSGDSEAMFGFARSQPNMTYSNSNLPSPYIFSLEEIAQDTNVMLGRGTFASGASNSLRDVSGTGGLSINVPTPSPTTLTVNSDGTFNGSFNGANQDIGATNGTNLIDLTETGIPAELRVWEQ